MSNITLFQRKDFSVITNTEALEAREEAIAVASLVRAVKDDASRDAAVEAQRGIKTLTAAAERDRSTLKKPVLDLGRLIDSTAQDYCLSLQESYTRLDAMVCEYEEEKRDLARRIEEVRQREIREAAAKIEAERLAAEKERLRIEAGKQAAIRAAEEKAARARNEESRSKAQAEAEKLKAQEAERLKSEESKRIEEAKSAADTLEQKRAEMGPPVALNTANGQSVKEEWDYRVTNIHQLYLSRGQQCVDLTEKRGAILALINVDGIREVPGLEIFKVTKNRVSAGRQRQGAIDV